MIPDISEQSSSREQYWIFQFLGMFSANMHTIMFGWYSWLGDVELLRGSLKSACMNYEKAREIYSPSEHSTSRFRLLECLWEQKCFKKALTMCEKLLSLCPESALLIASRGNIKGLSFFAWS